MNQIEKRTKLLNFEYWCALILGVTGLIVFVQSRVDPWSWPSLDMATFYAAIDHPSLRSSDFFTSCFGRDNGRQAFGALTSLPMFFGLGWYQTIYLWMIVGSALLPVSLFMGLQSAIPTRSKKTALAFFSFLLIAILYPVTARYSVVAWWSSWGNEFHPSRFAISLVFLSVRSFVSKKMVSQVLGMILVLVAVLCHPSFALGGILFVSVLLFSSRRYQSIIKLTMSALVALLVISVISTSGSLSTSDYLNWFVWLHPEHYIPSRFLSMTMGSVAWFYPALTISSVLVTAGAILFLLGAKRLARVCVWFSCLYGVSILVQFVFVEKFPLFKPVLLLAPIRFTAFGWLMAIVASTLVFTKIADYFTYPALNQETIEDAESADDLSVFRPTRNFRIAELLSIILIIFASVSAVNQLEKPINHLDPSKQQLLLWIEQNTDIQDEIAAPDFLTVEIPLLTFRGTYHGNGFPFNDRCLEENSQRFINLWGSPKSADWPGYSSHYDALTVLDFENMSPHVDWVIMKSKSPGAERSSSLRKSSYENQNYVLYQIGKGHNDQ